MVNNFVNNFKKIMNQNLVNIDDDDIINIVGSVHKDIAREATRISILNNPDSPVVAGLHTPWGRYWVDGGELKFEYIPDEVFETDVPWDAFESLEVSAQPWISLSVKNDGTDIDFGEIFWSAISVAMAMEIKDSTNVDSKTNVNVSIPISSDIGKYIVSGGDVKFAPGKELKQIIKDDLANITK